MKERWVVLIGGSGFVGRHLASWLDQNGWRVRIASRHAARDMPCNRIVAVRADLRDQRQLGSAINGAYAVVNLVGIAREREQSYEAVHVEGAASVARLSTAAGVQRLLHFSALGIAEDA